MTDLRTTPPRRGTPAMAVVVVLLVVAVVGWWARRGAVERARTEALAPWVGAELPEPGDPVDDSLASLGAELFRAKCASCHAVRGESPIGPELAGVTERRSPAWLQAMILAPDSMVREDPAAQSLKIRYQVQMMVPGGIDAVETRAVLEFLRRVDAGPREG